MGQEHEELIESTLLVRLCVIRNQLIGPTPHTTKEPIEFDGLCHSDFTFFAFLIKKSDVSDFADPGLGP